MRRALLPSRLPPKCCVAKSKASWRRNFAREAHTNTQTNPPIIEGIDFEATVALIGSEPIYIDVLKAYYETTPALLREIKIVTAENLAAYAIVVHGIKSSSRTVGAKTLGAKAEAAEAAAKAGKLDETKSINIELHELAEKLIAALQIFFKSYNKANAQAKKDKPDTVLLQKLFDACACYDMEVIDASMSDLEKYQYTADDGVVIALREKINVSDFAGAQSLLQKWL